MAVTDYIKKYYGQQTLLGEPTKKSPLLRDTVEGLPRALSETLGQPTLRAYAGIGSFIANRFGLSETASLKPQGEFQKKLFGTDKPISLTSVGEEVGVPKGSAFAAPVGLVLGAADLVPGGKGAKSLLKVPKELKSLAQEARKYKSAEEFMLDITDSTIKGKGRVYEGLPTTPRAIDDFNLGKQQIGKINSTQRQTSPEVVSQWKSRIEAGERPPVVTRTGLSESQEWIMDGHNRLKAYQELGFTEVPTVTKSQLTDFYNQVTKDVQKASQKVRGFVQSAKEIVPEADRIAGQYIPRSTDELAVKAKNLIKDDINLAEKLAVSRSDDAAVATASELLKKYADDAARATDESVSNALYDKAAEIANTLAPKLTEQGRSIQAASILGRLTPEGQVRFAAREILRHNETAPLAKQIPEITGEQTQFILNEMKEINAMADGVERAMRFQKLQNYIQDLTPTPLIKKVVAVWKAGLLTGLKTQGLNIFSNLFHGVSEIVKDIPAVAVDSAAALFTGKRTKTLTTKGVTKGVKEGFDKGIRYFKTGFDERNIGAKLDYRRVNFGKGVAAKAFQNYTDTVFRFLGAQDQPFYYGALARSLMDQALAQGKNLGLKGKELVKFAEELVQAPTEDMIRYGVADATTAVFQNKTKLGEAARQIQKIPGVGEIILPFGRTPSAVAMQIVNYSPVGVAKTIIENIGKGKFDQRLFSQGIGRGLTGTAILAIGAELFKNGLVSLDYPIGDEREQELQKAEGVKPNSIKVDDKWRSPIALGPLGNVLLVGGHFQNALEEAGSPTEALSMALLGGAKSFTEQTFLTGISQAVNAITDPERYAKSYLPNLIASFVPTLVSDVSRATDPKERRAETTLQRIQKRVPGARRELEPQVDILGRERESVGNPLEIMADPSRPSPDVGTLVTGELRRLMDAGYRVSPTALGSRKGYEGLTQEQNTELWKTTGEILSEKLTALFNDPRYLQLSDDEKAEKIEEFVRKAKLYGRVSTAIKVTDGLVGTELKEKLAELKEGGLMNRQVFNKYIELR